MVSCEQYPIQWSQTATAKDRIYENWADTKYSFSTLEHTGGIWFHGLISLLFFPKAYETPLGTRVSQSIATLSLYRGWMSRVSGLYIIWLILHLFIGYSSVLALFMNCTVHSCCILWMGKQFEARLTCFRLVP